MGAARCFFVLPLLILSLNGRSNTMNISTFDDLITDLASWAIVRDQTWESGFPLSEFLQELIVLQIRDDRFGDNVVQVVVLSDLLA